LDRDAACGKRKAAQQIKKNRGEGAEGIAARGIFAAGGGKGGRKQQRELQRVARNRAAPEEEEKGSFSRTYSEF
jgi:hypothetical protein